MLQDFTYKIYPLLDKPSEDIRRFFEEASDYIHELLNGGKKILVHCFAGKSRSTTIMIS
jgi:protein-tyrosine phosphatase